MVLPEGLEPSSHGLKGQSLPVELEEYVPYQEWRIVRESNPYSRKAITVFKTDKHAHATIRKWYCWKESNLQPRD